MYLPDAKIIWNGNTVSPNPIALSPFLDTLPLSRHDLQSLDCHPMPGTSLLMSLQATGILIEKRPPLLDLRPISS